MQHPAGLFGSGAAHDARTLTKALDMVGTGLFAEVSPPP
jgi:hypothetical protein